MINVKDNFNYSFSDTIYYLRDCDTIDKVLDVIHMIDRKYFFLRVKCVVYLLLNIFKFYFIGFNCYVPYRTRCELIEIIFKYYRKNGRLLQFLIAFTGLYKTTVLSYDYNFNEIKEKLLVVMESPFLWVSQHRELQILYAMSDLTLSKKKELKDIILSIYNKLDYSFSDYYKDLV